MGSNQAEGKQWGRTVKHKHMLRSMIYVAILPLLGYQDDKRVFFYSGSNGWGDRSAAPYKKYPSYIF